MRQRPGQRKTKICTHCSNEYLIYPSTANSRFCSSHCFAQHQSQKLQEQWMTGEKTTGLSRFVLRRYLIELHGWICQSCKLTEWLGRQIVLELDHIDGNPANDAKENLRMLCPNCHSTTPTWKAANKGSGRKSRGLSLG